MQHTKTHTRKRVVAHFRLPSFCFFILACFACLLACLVFSRRHIQVYSLLMMLLLVFLLTYR